MPDRNGFIPGEFFRRFGIVDAALHGPGPDRKLAGAGFGAGPCDRCEPVRKIRRVFRHILIPEVNEAESPVNDRFDRRFVIDVRPASKDRLRDEGARREGKVDEIGDGFL